MSELPRTFDPAEIEQRWYAHWESAGAFRPERPGAEPWTIVNPPPNVTGSLHIGHALDNTLQDILVRHARLQGKDARWVVGTDHAGIATQMVVERQMAERQDKRTNYSREDFVAKVWDWKAESGGAITGQLRRLGCSMDWANERFTMDEGFSKAVLKVFVDLYNEGLLYRDKRLVNWDPGLGTAISDLEVETREVQGKFWHLKYPLADGSGFIEVATTRPETMLADMAVAVHPSDERYTALIGKTVKLPITGREIPIVADEHADPELGSGAVKITPGHDFNDFEVGKRAGFKPGDMLNMLDAKAQIAQVSDGLIPADLIGLDRFDARTRVVAMLKEAGCLIPHIDKDGAEHDAEPRTIQTPYGDRSGAVIEPWLTDQWYVDAATLAKPAIEAVKSGAIRIVPKTWEKTFFNWMENIQPWCVSRQLWWGHRIPAWFGPTMNAEGHAEVEVLHRGRHERTIRTKSDTIFVAEDAEQAFIAAASHYSVSVEELKANSDPVVRSDLPHLKQDPDVLDTWFSSALWPFATMGWPDDIPPRDGEGDHAQHGGGAAVADGGLTPAAPPPPSAVPLPETSSGRNTLAGRYPNDILISGFDILFFWNARMMMQGIHFMGDVPFKTLYLHGLVRAADGQKMSKSKGNTVDPLGLIDQYGADALRFFMAAMESQGRDIKMDVARVEGYRNFATKLWNATRFAQSNGIGASSTLEAPPATLAVNKWIIGETIEAIQAVDLALVDLRFDGAANAIYQFVWSRFCDWYLELIKPVLSPEQGVRGEGPDAEETRAVAGWVLDQILVLLHPFMPFITEELWHAQGDRANDLIVAKWPIADARSIDPEAIREIDWLIRMITEIRATKSALDASAKPMSIFVSRCDHQTFDRLSRNLFALKRMTRAQEVQVRTPAGLTELEQTADISGFAIDTIIRAEGDGEVQLVAEGLEAQLDFYGEVDIAAARDRILKAIAAAEKERDALAGRLNNPSFVERAKPEAVEKARADHAEKAADAERLSAALARLG